MAPESDILCTFDKKTPYDPFHCRPAGCNTIPEYDGTNLLEYVIQRYLNMEKTALKSVRMPVTTLEEVEAFSIRYHYVKPHGVIVQCLVNLFRYADYNTIRTLVRHWPYSSKKLVITVTEVEEL